METQTVNQPVNRQQRRALARTQRMLQRKGAGRVTREIMRHRVNPRYWQERIDWSRPFDESETLDILLRARTALGDMMAGGATRQMGEYLSMVINTAIVRAESISEELVQEIMPGADAMVRALARFHAGKSLTLDAEGRKALPAAIDAYEAILQASSPLQMDGALREAYRRITGGKVL